MDRIRSIEESVIDGLGSVYEKVPKGSGPEEIVRRLRQHAVHAHLPLPGGRGLYESFSWILQLLQRRRFLKDLGEHPASVDWLSLHVPPGGAASFSIENKSKKKAGVTLRLFGAGFGSGRAVTLAVKENFLERKRCARLTHHVTLWIRTFDVGRGPKHPLIESNVIRVRHLEVQPWDPCPFCSQRAEELDPFEYEPAGPGLDLTRDEVGQKRSEVVHLTATELREIGVPLRIPGIPNGKIGLSTERQMDLTCKMDYTFPPGAFFTPYKAAGSQINLPFWVVH